MSLDLVSSELAASATSEAPGPDNAPAARRGHRVFSTILIVLGSVLTPITILALFVHTEISDTDRYVQNVSPLASNPAIQSFVADDISNRLIARINEKQYIASLLPSRAQPLVAPLRNAFDGFVHSTTLKVVQSDQFQKAWDSANRLAHTQLNNVLTGAHSDVVVRDSNGVVSIDVSAIVQKVILALRDSGIDVFKNIPIVAIGSKIPIFQSKDLYKVRKAVGALNTLAFVLPFLVFACFGGAILLARNRRRAFLWSAIGFALGAAMLALGLTLGRSAYLDAVNGTNIPHDAAAAVYDTMIRFLHTSVRAALLFSIIVVLAVFFAGPSRLAKGFRNRTDLAVERLGAGSEHAGWTWLGPIGAIGHHKGAWRVGIAVVAFVVLFRWPHPTPLVVFSVSVVALCLLAIVEYFGREQTQREIAAQ